MEAWKKEMEEEGRGARRGVEREGGGDEEGKRQERRGKKMHMWMS